MTTIEVQTQQHPRVKQLSDRLDLMCETVTTQREKVMHWDAILDEKLSTAAVALENAVAAVETLPAGFEPPRKPPVRKVPTIAVGARVRIVKHLERYMSGLHDLQLEVVADNAELVGVKGPLEMTYAVDKRHVQVVE